MAKKQKWSFRVCMLMRELPSGKWRVIEFTPEEAEVNRRLQYDTSGIIIGEKVEVKYERRFSMPRLFKTRAKTLNGLIKAILKHFKRSRFT